MVENEKQQMETAILSEEELEQRSKEETGEKVGELIALLLFTPTRAKSWQDVKEGFPSFPIKGVLWFICYAVILITPFLLRYFPAFEIGVGISAALFLLFLLVHYRGSSVENISSMLYVIPNDERSFIMRVSAKYHLLVFSLFVLLFIAYWLWVRSHMANEWKVMISFALLFTLTLALCMWLLQYIGNIHAVKSEKITLTQEHRQMHLKATKIAFITYAVSIAATAISIWINN